MLFFRIISVKQILFSHRFILFQVLLPDRTNLLFRFSLQNIQPYLTGSHQKIKPFGTGKERFSGIWCTGLISFIELEYILQRKSLRYLGGSTKVYPVAVSVFVQRILVRSL